MKGYVGTILSIKQSVDVAQRCIDSGKKFGVHVENVPAVYRDVSEREMKNEGLSLGTFNTSFSNIWSVVGNFITQYRIWKKILDRNEPGIVLEHDAIFIDNIPELNDDIVNIGKPSYGKFNTKDKAGIYPMFSKNGGYIPGAHAYYVTPNGAKQLISKAKEIGVFPADIFIHRKNFPQIKEYYPWPVIADDSFTTIQKQKGCTAKHNFNKDFKIL